MANRFRELVAAGVQDPAQQLMRDAVRDEDLFRELLQAEIGPDGQLPEKARNRLHAWAAGVEAERRTRPEDDQAAPSATDLQGMLGP